MTGIYTMEYGKSIKMVILFAPCKRLNLFSYHFLHGVFSQFLSAYLHVPKCYLQRVVKIEGERNTPFQLPSKEENCWCYFRQQQLYIIMDLGAFSTIVLSPFKGTLLSDSDFHPLLCYHSNCSIWAKNGPENISVIIVQFWGFGQKVLLNDLANPYPLIFAYIFVLFNNWSRGPGLHRNPEGFSTLLICLIQGGQASSGQGTKL